MRVVESLGNKLLLITIRKQYAGVGYSYDTSKNKFIGIKPYTSWSLNSDDDWVAPISYPTDSKSYNWNETTQAWDEV